MLNWTTVLKYIRGRLALPSTYIEKTDAQLQEWIEITAIPEFSQYFPDVERTGINTESELYQDPERQHTYLFFDDENLEIIGIKNMFFPQGDAMIEGHPFLGPYSFSAMKDWALDVFKARTLREFSNFNYNWKFISPNKVEILGGTGSQSIGRIVVEYEREHPKDLRKIPIAMKMLFQDLALAHVMIQIGNLRSWYGDDQITTPFGSIPLKGETLKSDGNELRERIVTQLGEASIPPIIIDIG